MWLILLLPVSGEMSTYSLYLLVANGNLCALIAFKGILHQASTQIPAVQEGSQYHGKRNSLGLGDITILPTSQLETEQQAPFLGLSVAWIGENSTQRRPSPKGPHQPLLKMEDFLPIMVEWEGSLFFCTRSFCSIVGIKVKKTTSVETLPRVLYLGGGTSSLGPAVALT